MKLGTLSLVLTCIFSASLPALAYTHSHRGPTSSKLLTKRAAKPKLLGPRAIDDSRATQIQDALIHSGYLTGQPSGHWDDQTQAAMQKLQGDNGWQTKLVPDSRAIIKLGLGPNPDPATAQASDSPAGPLGPQ